MSAIGRPVVRDCWRLTDCYGDMVTLACVFGYGRRRHCLTALIDSGDGDPWISELALLDQPARILRELRKVAADSAPIITLEQLDPAVAREVLEDGMAGTDRTWRQDVPPSVVELRAVALARCRSLPEPDRTVRPLAAAASGDSERAALVAEFLASPEAAGLDGGDSIRYCARLIVDFGADADGGRPLRVSPNKIERFLHDWVPRKFLLDEADRDAMPVVIAAWARWAAGRSDLPAEAIVEVINAADECGSHFAQRYDDPKNAGPARALLSGLELTGDPARTQDALDRRTFAMPYVGTRIGNDDYPQLNPGDPDDRRLLIEGEHPEYHGAGSRDVAGVNPDLHIALHEMVASQLWDDDPPDAWQAAKRLRDRGLDRHEILHRLADVAVQHLHGALTEGTPADAAAYARGLSKLAPGRKVKAGRTRTAGITPESVLLVKVSLRGAKPPIWRRLRLPSQLTLVMLHEALQAAFGWTDSHLHRFEADGRRFSHPDSDSPPLRAVSSRVHRRF